MEYKNHTLAFTRLTSEVVQVSIHSLAQPNITVTLYDESITQATIVAKEFIDRIKVEEPQAEAARDVAGSIRELWALSEKVEEPQPEAAQLALPEFHRPRTLEDLIVFHNLLDLDHEDYFSLAYQFHPTETIFAEDTRWVAVYWVEGGSEGYYVHIDRLTYDQALAKLVVTNLAIGKYWTIEAATKSVGLLTPFVHGLHEFVKELK